MVTALSKTMFLLFLRSGMGFFLRIRPFANQAFASSLVMVVRSASLLPQDPSHLLWSMFQVFIMLQLTTAVVAHSLWLMFQVSIMLRLTTVIVAQMVSFPITSNFYELVGFLLLLFVLKQPSHFTVSTSTTS
jgi:hypothetical protein